MSRSFVEDRETRVHRLHDVIRPDGEAVVGWVAPLVRPLRPVEADAHAVEAGRRGAAAGLAPSVVCSIDALQQRQRECRRDEDHCPHRSSSRPVPEFEALARFRPPGRNSARCQPERVPARVAVRFPSRGDHRLSTGSRTARASSPRGSGGSPRWRSSARRSRRRARTTSRAHEDEAAGRPAAVRMNQTTRTR